MGVDILGELDDLFKQNTRFKGAVLLTYALNLQFFEQIVQPRLDGLGCASVVIISDVFGYQETISRNLHQLTGVGRRYVCAPVMSNGRGVQHSKVLMLVSETQGWMLVGSGNLTFPGYGQNLELFDQFTFEQPKGAAFNSDEAYPFQAAWTLIDKLSPSLNQTAQGQLKLIREGAPWLTKAMIPPSELALWDLFDDPLFEWLEALTQVEELQVIAPFIDPPTVEQLLQHFRPERLLVGISAVRANIDGQSLAALCQSFGCELGIRAIRSSEGDTVRGLHAKAIIGIHADGSWCVSGSANLTRPALLDSWTNQGNLETVVYRESSDRHAFQSIWADQLIAIRSIAPQDTRPLIEEVSTPVRPSSFYLTELTERNGVIEGCIAFSSTLKVLEWWFELLLSEQRYPVVMDAQDRFYVQLQAPRATPDAGRICAVLTNGTQVWSPEKFIDQPYELERYTARTFHRSMQSRLVAVSDAAHTFRELMEFLFERRNPEAATRDAGGGRIRGKRAPASPNDSEEAHEILPIDAFITEENLNFYIGRHVSTLNPYDRDHYSLRDLLSLVLLRLTTETTPQRVLAASATSEEDERAIQQELENQQRIQRNWQEWLSDYLTQYCRRYSQRLASEEFLFTTATRLIFQNHYTLTRVLIEFHDKTETFSSSHLREAVRQIWSPLFAKQGALAFLMQKESGDTVPQIWHEARSDADFHHGGCCGMARTDPRLEHALRYKSRSAFSVCSPPDRSRAGVSWA